MHSKKFYSIDIYQDFPLQNSSMLLTDTCLNKYTKLKKKKKVQ